MKYFYQFDTLCYNYNREKTLNAAQGTKHMHILR